MGVAEIVTAPAENIFTLASKREVASAEAVMGAILTKEKIQCCKTSTHLSFFTIL